VTARRLPLLAATIALFLTSSCASEDAVDPEFVESIRQRLTSQAGEPTLHAPVDVALDLEEQAEYLAKQYAEFLRDRYIVVLDENALLTHGNGDPADLANRHGVTPHHVYRHALRGFSATLSAQQLENLQGDPQVKSIQPDSLLHTTDLAVPFGIDRVDADLNPTARIDASDERVGVAVAIIDTGIHLAHADLNVQGGIDLCTAPGDPTDNGGEDVHGHGTHCAGTVGALDDGYNFGMTGYQQAVMGVAPGVPLWAVRVCDSSGSCPTSDIVNALDWITGCVTSPGTCPPGAGDIKVANMSLGCECGPDCYCGGTGDVKRIAIDAMAAAGVTLATSAGNDDTNVGTQGDGCLVTPSCFDTPIVVASMTDFDGTRGRLSSCPDNCYYTGDTDDDTASYSNYGSQVDIIAPGTCIRSTYHDTGCNDCVRACPGATYDTYCATTSRHYMCCKNAGCAQCEAEIAWPADKNGLCYDSSSNVYLCVHAKYAMMSGTSMASPHVAGAAALFIEEYHRNTGDYPTPAQVKTALTTNGDALPCGTGTGSSCRDLSGTPGLFVGEHRDAIEVSGYSMDALVAGDGFAVLDTFEHVDGVQSLGMGVDDTTTGGTHGYSLVKFCLTKNELDNPIDDYFKASAYVKFDSHTDWTGFGVSNEVYDVGSWKDVWLYWWWIRADGTVLDTFDRLGGASVFDTTDWHHVEIAVDRRSADVASLSVDGTVETGIPLTNWDPTSVGMRCLFFFSGVTVDTDQDMYVDHVHVRAHPGGTFPVP
jgi:subtilisin family serine protease